MWTAVFITPFFSSKEKRLYRPPPCGHETASKGYCRACTPTTREWHNPPHLQCEHQYQQHQPTGDQRRLGARQ